MGEKKNVTKYQLGRLRALRVELLRPCHALAIDRPDLSDHGLTEEQFEKAIRQVSSDPAASKRYAAAYKRNT